MKDIKFTVCLFVCLFVCLCLSGTQLLGNCWKFAQGPRFVELCFESDMCTAVSHFDGDWPDASCQRSQKFFLGRQCFFFWQPWLPKKCPSVDLKALRNNALFQKQFIGELFRDRPKHFWTAFLNPLEPRGNYNATSNNMKLVHWPLMGGLLHLIQRGGDWAGPQPAQAPSRCTKCYIPLINGQCTNHRIAI